MRYFNQVRRRGLETIVRAYTMSSKTVLQFNMTRLMSMLAFESVQECSKFCSSHGIEAEPDSDIVYMERTAFFNPESLPFKRARVLVESKRQVPWSEVIHGGPLPMNPYLDYEPHDSFDDNGYLKQIAYDASDQALELSPGSPMTSTPQVPLFQPPPVQPKPDLQAQKELARWHLEQALVQVGDEILKEVLKEECNEISTNATVTDIVAHETMEEIHTKIVSEMCLQITKETIKEAKNEELRSRLEKEARNMAAEDIKDDLINEVIEDMAKEVSKQEMFRVDKLLKYHEISPLVANDLVNEVINELLEPEAKNAIDEAIKDRDEKIQKLRDKQILALKKRTFKSWFRYSKKRKSQRDLLKNFPCIPGSRMFKTTDMKSYSLKDTLKLQTDVEKLHQVIELEDKYIEETLLKPFNDFVKIVNEQKLKQRKILVFGPALENASIGKGLVEVVKKKLSINPGSLDENHDPNLLSCFSSPMTSFCSRWLDQSILDEEIAYSEKKRRDYLTGTSGLLFIHVDEEETMNEASARLVKILDLIPKVPGISLMILTTSKASEESLKTSLHLDDLDHVQAYEIRRTSVDIFAINTVTSVSKSLVTLAKMCKNFDLESVDGLTVKMIRDYVEDFIAERFLAQIYLDSYDAKSMINYYNDIIDHLANVLLDKELEQISWPIPELKRLVCDEEIPSYWNDAPYLEQVGTWIKNLKLPLYTNDLGQ